MQRIAMGLLLALVASIAPGSTGEECNEFGWTGIDLVRWAAIAQPDGESLACDQPKPPDCGSDCDSLWHSDCDLFAIVTKPIALGSNRQMTWDFTGPDRTERPGLPQTGYYPCVYFCGGWFWFTTECQWMCTDGDACCLTTCNDLGMLFGDADGDGDVDLQDYQRLQLYIGSGGEYWNPYARDAAPVIRWELERREAKRKG